MIDGQEPLLQNKVDKTSDTVPLWARFKTLSLWKVMVHVAVLIFIYFLFVCFNLYKWTRQNYGFIYSIQWYSNTSLLSCTWRFLHAHLSRNYEHSNCKFSLLNFNLSFSFKLSFASGVGIKISPPSPLSFFLRGCRSSSTTFKSVEVDTLRDEPFLSYLITILSNLPFLVCNLVSSR